MCTSLRGSRKQENSIVLSKTQTLPLCSSREGHRKMLKYLEKPFPIVKPVYQFIANKWKKRTEKTERQKNKK